MKRISVLILLLAAGSLSFATGQEPKPVLPKPLVVEPVTTKPAVRPANPAGRRELSLRERRQLGLTVANLVEIAKELKAEGEIEAGTPRGEVAASIAVRLTEKNPEGFKDSEALDLDSIIAFIERLLPLILKLIDLFS